MRKAEKALSCRKNSGTPFEFLEKANICYLALCDELGEAYEIEFIEHMCRKKHTKIGGCRGYGYGQEGRPGEKPWIRIPDDTELRLEI